jgi:hypothetical protein
MTRSLRQMCKFILLLLLTLFTLANTCMFWVLTDVVVSTQILALLQIMDMRRGNEQNAGTESGQRKHT